MDLGFFNEEGVIFNVFIEEIKLKLLFKAIETTKYTF